jgi:hypothetical protein
VTFQPPPGAAPSRRAVLAGGLAGLAGAGLAGCTDSGTVRPSAVVASTSGASPADQAAVGRARTAAAELAAAADRLASAGGATARLLADVAADHRAHLAALGAPSPSPASTSTPAASTSPSGSAPAREGLAAAARAEVLGAQTALDDVLATSPAVAALLARIAATRAAHADLLSAAAGLRPPGELAPSPQAVAAAPTTPAAGAAGVAPPAADVGPLPPPPAPVASPTAASPGASALPGVTALAAAAREALVALTAGEHAAVFAYGLVAARVPAKQRDRARDGWSWHLARRDQLEERLLAAGVEPPAAAPAYDVGGTPTAGGAVRLAATVEQRLAALSVRTVSATQGDDRGLAASGLVAGVRRAVAWSGRTQALPG